MNIFFKAMSDWRMRLHIDGHTDSPYMRLRWPVAPNDGTGISEVIGSMGGRLAKDADWVVGGVGVESEHLDSRVNKFKRPKETDADVNDRVTLTSSDDLYDGAITTYRNSLTVSDVKM